MNQSNKALRELLWNFGKEWSNDFEDDSMLIEETLPQILALVTNHIKGALPEKKWPATIDDIPKFTEPIIAETINSKSTIDPWVNKGYNQALEDVNKVLEEVSNADQ